MTSPARPDRAARLRALRSQLDAHHVDAFVVSTPHNIVYLTGFVGTAGLLVVTHDAATLIVDGRYVLAARQGIEQGEVADVAVAVVERRYDLTLGVVLRELDVRRAGFEAANVTVATLRGWERAASGVAWSGVDGLVERLRIVKDDFELGVLRRGGGLISDVARQLGSIVRAGQTERSIAKAIDLAIERAGFSGPAFPTIVASGPNSAKPHARPTDRTLGRGDLVVLDFGGVLDGYCVDVTRMAAVGPLADRAQALFSAVKVAQEAAILAVRPAAAASDVDSAARSALDARGFGEAFTHSTGHGLGLDVHEAPRIGRADPEAPETLQAGMVFTIEPGAYVEGVGGVRLEDDVLVTAGGCEVLTTAPRDLLVV
jgi:Xaa-Pro aminopeptidase